MGSRDRDNKSLQDKVKEFFNKKAAMPARNELVVTAELARELGAGTPLQRRLRAAKDFGERALLARIHEGGVERVWGCTRDLLGDGSAEARHAALTMLRCVAEGQADRLLVMRTILFRYLRDSHAHAAAAPEDQPLRFKLLHTLTNSGKNISCFEEEIGPFLLEWLPEVEPAAQVVEFVQLITNVVKFNATYLDEEIVHGIVNAACHLCEYSAEAACVQAALALLEAVVSYSLLPRAALPVFVAALCRTVNIEHYCQPSWKLMRSVLGADIGHAALAEMVAALRGGEGCAGDAGLARGAVFYINMALWGPRRVPALRVSFLAVLPALLEFLAGHGNFQGELFSLYLVTSAECECGEMSQTAHHILWECPIWAEELKFMLNEVLERSQPVVTYEVLLATQSLVSRAAHELHEPAWDVLLRLLRAAHHHDERLEPRNELIHARLHALLSAVEQLHLAGQYTGDVDALVELVDCCAHSRPEASAMWVVSMRCAALCPATREGAAAALALAERYLRAETRRAVRLHTLHALHTYIMRHRLTYGSELTERVGVPVLGACAIDADPAVRAAAARALSDLARLCASDLCAQLIDLLEKILNRPFELEVEGEAVRGAGEVAGAGGEAGDEEGEPEAAACDALLQVLHARLLRAPAAHAARCFVVLLDHLEAHYRPPPHPHPPPRASTQPQPTHRPDIRIKILDMMFGLRANAFNCVGFCYDERGAALSPLVAARARPLCSPFLLVEAAPLSRPLHPAPPPPATRDLPPGACVLPVGRAARTLTAALTRETDWGVLAHVLRALPPLLQVRALAVGRRAQDLDMLASTLCSMVSDRSLGFPECLRVSGGSGGGGAAGGKLTVSEFHSMALPPLGALAPYHAYLEPHTQQRIVRCLLKYGMVLRAPQPYMNALTVFTLETRDTMVKMLPEVLLDLSKISDTKLIASPMLEFLSTLTRLPRVFASFVEDQYMSVFAIVLPYTNPSRYNHYVVSLAHHVIAAWFLKCRLAYRRNFVRFIIHGLHNYIIMPFEEQLQSRGAFPPSVAAASAAATGTANEDSSNRQRSSSLGSRAVSRAPLGARGSGGAGGAGSAASASASAAFHVELTETCVDLLSRYAFTPCSVKPQRSAAAQFMFEGGQTGTWLVGHKLVTITTSGCAQNSIKQGLCDRCAALCRRHAESAASPLPPLAPAAPVASAAQAPAQEEPQPPRASPAPAPAPAPPDVKRQNSGDGNKASDPVLDALTHFSQRFERISREVDTEEPGWSRVGALLAAGTCPCWSAPWAEVHVRSPTGDVSWAMRTQNQMSWDHLLESPLQEAAAVLCAPAAPAAPPAAAKHDAAGASAEAGAARASAAAHAPSQLLHKSSSDSVVLGERRARAPHAASDCIMLAPAALAAPPSPPPLPASAQQQQRMSTQPINIPGSPQRQSSASTTDDDDMLLIVPAGKSRHPVRRSNSSPEMSSSWKLAPRDEPAPPAPPRAPPDPAPSAPADTAPDTPEQPPGAAADPSPADTGEMILLPSCEPTSASLSMHHSKKAAKKSDMRVSCEAIPEETPGTSPHAPHHQHQHHQHHLLMTYNSDPGSCAAAAADGAGRGEEGGATAAASASERAASAGGGGGSEAPPSAPAPAPARATDRDDLPPLARSKRSNTISVMSPTRRHREAAAARAGLGGSGGGAAAGGGGGGAGGGGSGGGVTPSFVFLQLYHNMSTYPITPPVPGEAPTMLNPLAERPLRVSGVQHERTVKNLDLVPPLDSYKVGVLYVGPGQHDNEVAILRNEYGSVRYAEFLTQLGTLVSLQGARDELPDLFLNLETGGKDGRYTYVWTDDVMQVVFHVATAMPSLASDPACHEKLKYIGNDFVSIVYNDSGADFNIHTIKGQFNVCVVVVEPLEHGMNRVLIKTKDELIRSKFLAHHDALCVSDPNVALLARQVALHCALAAQISQSLKMGGAAYASNSLERLRLIKRLRRRVEAERLAAAARASPAPYAGAGAPHLAQRVAIDDFNDYT